MSTMTKTSESPHIVASLTCIALYVIALISVPLACLALSKTSPILQRKRCKFNKNDQVHLLVWLAGCPSPCALYSGISIWGYVRCNVSKVSKKRDSYPSASKVQLSRFKLVTEISFKTRNSVEKMNNSSSKKLYSRVCMS